MKSLLIMLLLANVIPQQQIRARMSPMNKNPIILAQVQTFGSRCQTRFGICPMLDPAGQSILLPLGSPCGCGGDPGFVIQ